METKQETRFKMIIYFIKKPNNDFYTIQEIEEQKHLRWIGSYDIIRGKDKKWIKHEESAFRKQVHALEKTMHGRYKTAAIVINNYKGYSIMVRKYVDGVIRFNMNIEFYEFDQRTGESIVYNIPAANNLIELFEAGQLSDVQKKLIKKVDNKFIAAKPYLTNQKLSDKFKNLKTT